nr:helix-turn-helix transcriptional regulator [Pedobacter panaciterrae]
MTALSISQIKKYPEKEIICLLAQGKTSYEIADVLFISKNTVDTHRLRFAPLHKTYSSKLAFSFLS